MCENEPDSEDDYEGYFLKPVNEYNIVDRIKNANEELFATPTPPSPSVLNRKVQFRKVLEDYEPHEAEDEFDVKVQDNNPEQSDDTEKGLESKDRTVSPIPEDCPGTDMSDSSDPEIEEICEDIDSLEVQDPNSDCDRSITTDQRDDKPGVSLCIPLGVERGVSPSITPSSPERTTSHQIDATTNSADVLQNQGVHQQNSCDHHRLKIKPSTQYGGDILKLRLNYKTCCEYKNAIDNLPRYSGYFSQYGLSKEQWERREKRYEKNRKKFFERSMNATETETKKMEDNERAFTNWLRNKMRFPLNKTKNMFDFKPNKLKRRKKPNEVSN